MTGEEFSDDLELFHARLTGVRDPEHAAYRLGASLRENFLRLLHQNDDASQMRVWKRITLMLEENLADHPQRSSSGTSRYLMRWAQAAALVGIGVFAGWAVRSPYSPSRVEFAFGELERQRGDLRDVSVLTTDPAETLRSFTALLIAQNVPFELYSTADPSQYRIVLVIPEELSDELSMMFGELGLSDRAGDATAITFQAGGNGPDARR